ncbi:MAG: alkyl sulfatase dimerization domain-containing protein [Acidimicrobiales bacterium]
MPFSGAGTLIPPTVLVDDELHLEVAGVPMEIVWIPSEANTEIGVWLPDHGVLQTAECVQGECYPNVYTIRGDVPRPAQRWVDALDNLRAYPAEALAKSHGRCIVGSDDAAEHLLAYRDSIAWMHDQTVRWMNNGLDPDQIVERIGDLPDHLAAHRHCGVEGYGAVSHSSRSVYSWYLGFNTGTVTDFDPATVERRARGYVQLAGGRQALLENAAGAHAEGDNQWAIELLGWLLKSDPGDAEARRLSAAAHRARGLEQHNATWRNWYLTAALELDGVLPMEFSMAPSGIYAGLPTSVLLTTAAVRLAAERTADLRLRIGIDVAGVADGRHTIELRGSVLDHHAGDGDTSATIIFTNKAAIIRWAAGGERLPALVDEGICRIDGSAEDALLLDRSLDDAPSMFDIYVTLHSHLSELPKDQ